MIAKLLGAKWKLWVIGALLLALSVLFWQWRAEIRNAAQWAIGFDQVERANEQLAADIEALRREQAANERLAREHQAELEALWREYERDTARRRELEREDSEYAEWADDCLPGAVRKRLHITAPCGDADEAR